MGEKLTSLAKRLRPFIAGMINDWINSGAIFSENELNRIIHLYNGDTTVVYIKSTANLTTALAAVSSGEIIQIHGPCSLTDDFVIPANATLQGIGRDKITLNGTIYLNENSRIENLIIYAAADSADPVYGVVGPGTGTAEIFGCDITAYNAGAGNAYAIGAIRGIGATDGNIVTDETYLYGVSDGGDGYAARSLQGAITCYSGRAYGSTARYIIG